MREFYGPEQVRRVRESVDVGDVLARYAEVRKGQALCLFHAERTPSLHVYRDHFHCFGCGAHGDAIDLVRHKEGLDFQAAVRLVAEIGGIRLENQARQRQPDDAQAAALGALEFAAGFYEAELARCPEALAYLSERRITAATAQAFRVGWAPGGSRLVEAAQAAGITPAALEGAGLIREGRDFFFRRLVVPVCDGSGEVLAFTGRALPADIAARPSTPKYINSGETNVYHKGSTVFGLYRAKTAARAAKRLLVVEGALDVIACAQGGYAEAVAPLGTACTAEQAALIARAARDLPVVVALDSDAAGDKGAVAAVAQLTAAGAVAKLAQLPADRDPAELLLEGGPQGAAGFASAVAGALTAWPWLVSRWMGGPAADLTEAQRLAVFDQVLALTGTMSDEDLRDGLRSTAAAQIGIKAQIAARRAKRTAEASATATAALAQADAGGDDEDEPPADEKAHPGTFRPEFDLNDTGNARRILSFHGDDLRFCHTWGVWLVWKGTHWAMDQDRSVERIATAALAASLAADLERLDAEPRSVRSWWLRALQTWRTRSGDRARVVNALEQLATLAEVSTTADAWDRDPLRFTVANGTIDLARGALMPHDRDDHITRLCPIAYDPQARDDRWERFLAEFAGGHRPVVEYLQRMAGYAMTGDTRDDAVLLLQGPGGDGKSTFASSIAAVLGDYARPIPFETFLSQNADKSKWSLAECSQMRLVVAEESQEDAIFNSALLKSLTGGGEIEAARKHGHPFRYVPRFKVWLLTNPLPNVRDTDQGFWRRLHLVRCQTATNPDRSLRPYLANNPQAQAAILAWAVEGARQWAAQGLCPPPAVIAWRDSYRQEQNPLTDFLAEACIVTHDESDIMLVGDWTRLYRAWCETHGQRHPLSAKAAFQRLSVLGVAKGWGYDAEAHRSVRAYVGIRSRHATDPQPAEPIPGSFGSPHMGAGSRGGCVASCGDTAAPVGLGGEMLPTAPQPQPSTASPGSVLPHVPAVTPQDATHSPRFDPPMCGDPKSLENQDLDASATDATDPTRTRALRAREAPHAGEDKFFQSSSPTEKERNGSESVAPWRDPPPPEPGSDPDEPPWPTTPDPRTPTP